MCDSISARLSSESQTGKLKLFLNLTRSQVAFYSIEEKPFISIARDGGDYLVKFHREAIANVTNKWKASISRKRSEIMGATISLDPAFFDIDQKTKVLGVVLPAVDSSAGLRVTISPDLFALTETKQPRTIDSRASKIASGFTVPSSWGEDLEYAVPVEMDRRIDEYLRKKYS